MLAFFPSFSFLLSFFPSPSVPPSLPLVGSPHLAPSFPSDPSDPVSTSQKAKSHNFRREKGAWLCTRKEKAKKVKKRKKPEKPKSKKKMASLQKDLLNFSMNSTGSSSGPVARSKRLRPAARTAPVAAEDAAARLKKARSITRRLVARTTPPQQQKRGGTQLARTRTPDRTSAQGAKGRRSSSGKATAAATTGGHAKGAARSNEKLRRARERSLAEQEELRQARLEALKRQSLNGSGRKEQRPSPQRPSPQRLTAAARDSPAQARAARVAAATRPWPRDSRRTEDASNDYFSFDSPGFLSASFESPSDVVDLFDDGSSVGAVVQGEARRARDYSGAAPARRSALSGGAQRRRVSDVSVASNASAESSGDDDEEDEVQPASQSTLWRMVKLVAGVAVLIGLMSLMVPQDSPLRIGGPDV